MPLGLLNQVVSRIGLFRLKVKDPSLCARCPTKDCARACPVGNSDLPINFIRRGYYKSSTCIGVGDYVETCPYNNIYFYDVRIWLSERLNVKSISIKRLIMK
ncbi:4Fe-4S ferredoxin iron-sulfur binding domain protein [Vulcanisaeta moutnovskia 768-28]|uniref:4Fe-4S ferredoxin iron-sulfur binding domain protein n=1 Tax=Vulcanisaeta moutnovskia (strain 768-28) TaxID=985053 RepID=F0QWB0_VULM7|nr:hypothetical protein [Vulcanisaeta moutnovskia]ADY02205.1 4Fe-4S ferredoxin iron-sulfur binding domain protein [Vulcanisaeta moutnovskia 768-28]